LGVGREASHLALENLFAKQSQPINAGWTNGQIPRRAKQNSDLWLYVSTWNVRTMLNPGKMNKIAEQMLRTQLQIIALQEIRWKGHGQIKKNTYSLYYSCSEQTTRHFGTGFLVKKKLKRILCPLLQSTRKYAQLDSKENFIT
jgi:hypothetical protein